MKTKERIRLIIGIIINAIVVCLVSYCLSTFIKYLVRGNPDIRFRYFTNISNLTVGAIAIFNIVFLVWSLIKKDIVFPKVLSIIKLVGLSMTTLTFFTVLFVIAPLTSYKEMYENVRFITHLVVPILVVVSYLFFEEKTLFEWKYSFFGAVPMVIYGMVYIPNVVFLKTWPDLYKINTHGLWFLFVILFCIADLLVALGLYFLKRFVNKKLEHNTVE